MSLRLSPHADSLASVERGLVTRRALGILAALLSGAAAFLLIVIQPSVTNFMLPATGGHPLLWHGAQALFLALLVSGYWLIERYPQLFLGKTAVIPLGAAALAAAWPIQLGGVHPNSIWSALGWIALLVGPAFVGLSTFSAGSQMAFLRLTQRDPYWLYAASNVGSLLAAFSYSFVIEPRVDLHTQILVWRFASALILLFGSLAVMGRAQNRVYAAAGHEESTRVGVGRLRWVIAGLIPVAISLSCTSYLTVIYGAHPLIWLAPFSLYLTTLALAFTRRGYWLVRMVGTAAPLAAVIEIALLISGEGQTMTGFLVHVLLATVVMARCNVWLASLRPPSSHLAEFYRYAALGGVAAALIVSLVAPSAFNPAGYPSWALSMLYPIFAMTTPEYLTFLILAVIVMPTSEGAKTGRWFGIIEALVLGSVLSVTVKAFSFPRLHFILVALGGILAVLIMTRLRGRLMIAVCVGALALVSTVQARRETTVHWSRSQFGQILVADRGWQRVLINGFTMHGSQNVDCARGLRPLACAEPTTYYARSGPAGVVVRSLRRAAQPLRMAVIGLGIGTMGAYCEPGDALTFYELDPAVVDVAERFFQFMKRARANCSEVNLHIGDGRQLAVGDNSRKVDFLTVDAFFSDAIPAHLMTVEGLRDLATLVNSQGVLAVHVSNRYFDLAPVVLAGIRALGLAGFVVQDRGGPTRSPSVWVMASPTDRVSDRLRLDFGFGQPPVMAANGPARAPASIPAAFRERPVSREAAPWTDARHSLLEVIRR